MNNMLVLVCHTVCLCTTQQDVSELYAFLLAQFRAPALPLSERLFHGGQTQASDATVSAERVLHLALPQAPAKGKSAVTLEQGEVWTL